MSHVVSLEQETRSSRLLMGGLLLCALVMSFAVAIQRDLLGFLVPQTAFAASVVPGSVRSATAGLQGAIAGSTAAQAFRFATPSTIRRSIPAARGLTGSVLPTAQVGTDQTGIALTDPGAPGLPGMGDEGGLLAPASAGGSSGSSGSGGGTGSPGGLMPIVGSGFGTEGGGGGAILAAVPEPATWLTMIVGLFAVAWQLRRKAMAALHQRRGEVSAWSAMI